MSQIIDYDNKDTEKLSLYARYLQPMLLERLDDNEVYLSNVIMSHYRFSKLRQQDLKLKEDSFYPLNTGSSGAGNTKDKQEDWLSKIVARLNDLFDTKNLTYRDLINYSQIIWDKVNGNQIVMNTNIVIVLSEMD